MGVVRGDHRGFLLSFKQQLNSEELQPLILPANRPAGKAIFGVGRSISPAQFDQQPFHIDRRRAGEMERAAVNRVRKAKLCGVQRLAPETQRGQHRAQSWGASTIDRVPQ